MPYYAHRKASTREFINGSIVSATP